MSRSRKHVQKSNRANKQAQIVKNKLQFPNCTKIYEECKGRDEPCVTCPYKESWKPKKRKNESNKKTE